MRKLKFDDPVETKNLRSDRIPNKTRAKKGIRGQKQCPPGLHLVTDIISSEDVDEFNGL